MQLHVHVDQREKSNLMYEEFKSSIRLQEYDIFILKGSSSVMCAYIGVSPSGDCYTKSPTIPPF